MLPVHSCAEILSIVIRNNTNIKGITINGKEYKISQYADDTSLFKMVQENLLRTLKFYARMLESQTKQK
jgi:hypothetical protein